MRRAARWAAPEGLIPVNAVDEIPEFASEDEEHEFWSTHSFGPGLLDQMTRED